MTVRIGVLGCGSVLWGPYLGMIERLAGEGRVEVTAVFDPTAGKRDAVVARVGSGRAVTSAQAVLEAEDVDLVGIFTSMNAHGPLTLQALAAGKHVLVEKPMATSLEEGRTVLAAAENAPGLLVCAPHVLLSPTYRAIRGLLGASTIGSVLSARARYGWAGPSWGKWFYEPGGGSLFDLGVYNVTSLCGLLGPVRRVTAMSGVAIAEREVEGERIRVEAEDNAHVLLDFGDSRFAVVTTGFTMQKYRSPAIELYGETGVVQLLGDDWAPHGYELWRNDHGAWEVFPEEDPGWQWTEGLRHLVECIEHGSRPVTRPEQAFHALEIMQAAKAAAADGCARSIESDFPAPDYSSLAASDDAVRHRRSHDPRSS